MKQAFILCGLSVLSCTSRAMSDFVRLISHQQFSHAQQQLDRLTQEELAQAQKRIETMYKSHQLTVDHVHHGIHVNPLAGFSSLFFLRSCNLQDMNALYSAIRSKMNRVPKL